VSKQPIRESQPLYRLEATGLELSYDVLETHDYIRWFVNTNYKMNTQRS
jgi:hypothetical protein